MTPTLHEEKAYQRSDNIDKMQCDGLFEYQTPTTRRKADRDHHWRDRQLGNAEQPRIRSCCTNVHGQQSKPPRETSSKMNQKNGEQWIGAQKNGARGDPHNHFLHRSRTSRSWPMARVSRPTDQYLFLSFSREARTLAVDGACKHIPHPEFPH